MEALYAGQQAGKKAGHHASGLLPSGRRQGDLGAPWHGAQSKVSHSRHLDWAASAALKFCLHQAHRHGTMKDRVDFCRHLNE